MFLILEHPKYCMALIHLPDRPFRSTRIKMIEKRSECQAALSLSQADVRDTYPVISRLEVQFASTQRLILQGSWAKQLTAFPALEF